ATSAPQSSARRLHVALPIFSAALQRQASDPGRLAEFTSFVLEHIAEDLRVPRLARALGMSPRTLTRWCRSELGEPPAEAVRRLRSAEHTSELQSRENLVCRL